MNVKKIKKYNVCVHCFTYNHAAYIEDTMNGFCMQKTTFPYLCVIIDDASTDGEAEIIKCFLNRNFHVIGEDSIIEGTDDYTLYYLQHRTNPNCFFLVYFLKYNHYQAGKTKKRYLDEWDKKAKYVAMCEGDDYWCSSNKLQIQVDFLESHPHHSLCFHANYSLYADGTKKPLFAYPEDKEVCPIEDMIMKGGGFMATASMVYVGSLTKDWPEWAQKAPVGDIPLMLVLAERGSVGYINELMSYYRVAIPGSWSVRISQNKKMRKKLHPQIVRYWKGFDEWTNFKYHKSVKKSLFITNVHYFAKTIPILAFIVKCFNRK